MIATIVGTLIRLAGEAYILWIVSHHAHWSIVLVFSLLTIHCELVGWILRLHGRQIRQKK